MAEVELVAVGCERAAVLLQLARDFHVEDGHPLNDKGALALTQAAHGHPLARAWLIHERARYGVVMPQAQDFYERIVGGAAGRDNSPAATRVRRSQVRSA